MVTGISHTEKITAHKIMWQQDTALMKEWLYNSKLKRYFKTKSELIYTTKRLNMVPLTLQYSHEFLVNMKLISSYIYYIRTHFNFFKKSFP